MAETLESQKMLIEASLKTIDHLHKQLEKSRLKRIDLKIENGRLLDILRQYNHLDEVSDLDEL